MTQVGINATHGLSQLKHLIHSSLGMLMALKRQGVRHNDIAFRNVLVRIPGEDNKRDLNRMSGAQADSYESSLHSADDAPFSRTLRRTQATRAPRISNTGLVQAERDSSGTELVTGTIAFPEILTVDFGAAASAMLGKSVEDFHKTSNKGHSDCFTIACSFYNILFNATDTTFCQELTHPPAGDDAGQLAVSVQVETFLARMIQTRIDPNGLPDYRLLQAQLKNVKTIRGSV